MMPDSYLAALHHACKISVASTQTLLSATELVGQNDSPQLLYLLYLRVHFAAPGPTEAEC